MDELNHAVFEAFGTDAQAAFDFGRVLAKLIKSPPRVRALVARIVAGGEEAAEDVCKSLRLRAYMVDERAHDPDSETAERLRVLAGEE